MKLMRYGPRDGRKTPCVVDRDGTPRDVSDIVEDFTPASIADGLIEWLTGADLSRLPVFDAAGSRIAAPVATPRNIWCVGLNYSDHAAESNMPVPAEPILFNKTSAAFCGPNDPILHSPRMHKLDWEVELGMVVGRQGLEIAPEGAMDHLLGFVLVNDVSERSWQLEQGGQWAKGKSFVNFCPTGPLLVTPDEIADLGKLDLWLSVNGERMQSGSTSNMIFDVPTIIAYISGFTRLEAGDLICTGTPPGVGAGQKPPRFLKPGDEVRLGVTGLGEQCQPVERMD